MDPSARPRFGSVVLDCPDPKALSDFYAELLGWPPDPAPDAAGGWARLNNPDGGPKIEFQRAEDYLEPTWPHPERPQMVHLDLTVTDLDESGRHAVAAGARLVDAGHETFHVYLDPAGHPFCLCAC